MVRTLQHAILTRFNLPSGGHESLVRARDGWLRERVGLFERFCLPSVRAQTSQDFAWLVYFDPESPRWLREWIDERHPGAFRPVFRAEVPRDVLLADIAAAFGHRGAGDLLTTNLDNDDSLARDFVARVQAAGRRGERTAVYVGDGLIATPTRLYRRVDPHNAFCSVREEGRDPVTCWSDWHNRLPDHMPTIVLRGDPGWLQTVHGGNVSNRVRGRRVGPGAYRDAFPGLLDPLPEPRSADLLRDALLATPGRQLGEAGRAAVKVVVGRSAGREGLDRAKTAWAAVRGNRVPARTGDPMG